MTDDEDGPELDGSTFRPYLLTGGRTRSVAGDIPIEALVVTRERLAPRGLTPEQAQILDACRSPISVAEIAVALAVPIGVARVLVSDLAATNRVEVCDTATRAEYELVRRLIAGVRAI
jgi:hypothetical protein